MNSANTAKSQREKFEEAARDLETNQLEKAVDRALKKIANTPPPQEDKIGSRELAPAQDGSSAKVFSIAAMLSSRSATR
jgi:hypothetical protein